MVCGLCCKFIKDYLAHFGMYHIPYCSFECKRLAEIWGTYR